MKTAPVQTSQVYETQGSFRQCRKADNISEAIQMIHGNCEHWCLKKCPRADFDPEQNRALYDRCVKACREEQHNMFLGWIARSSWR